MKPTNAPSATAEKAEDPVHVPSDGEDLMILALSDPDRALALARQILASGPDPGLASRAHQAAGIALRDRGQLPAALAELRAALRLARRCGQQDRVIDVSASYGAALVMAGRTRQGLAELDGAAVGASGETLARVRVRRAHILSLLGRHADAAVDLQGALRWFRRQENLPWQALVLNNRCLVHLALGATQRADADAAEAGRLYSVLGQDLPATQALWNRGYAALLRGDIPMALKLFDRAGTGYEKFDLVEPSLIMDRGRALMVAGLSSDAKTSIVDFIDRHDEIQPVKQGELLFQLASAALASGDSDTAARQSRAAQRIFAKQERPYWAARAAFVEVQARYTDPRRDRRLLSRAAEVAESLRGQLCEEAPLAFLLAGRIALELGSREEALRYLALTAAHRHRGPALQRATGWLARALMAEEDGSSRQVLTACRQGLDDLDEHRLVFGGTEPRALATAYGTELATIALRRALQSGRARILLIWSERWRATALSAPPLKPDDDAELTRDLAALRDAARRAEASRNDSASDPTAEKEQARWEAAVRLRRMKVAGRFAPTAGFDVEALEAALGRYGHITAGAAGKASTAARAVVLVDVDGTLYALTEDGRRVRRHEVGPYAEALREADFARFSLRRAAYGQRVADLGQIGERLQRALLGPALPHLGSGPLVVVPPARLHGAPWGLLPVMADRVLSVSPSLSIWMRALARPAPAHRTVSLVLGPGLSGAASEVVELRDLHHRAAVLAGADATAERALASLDGVWLAHIAAHGTFRSDSPLFSSLALEDGPLTVHDMDRLERPPYRVLLSACDVGAGEAVGADELLGLVSSLLGLGAAGVLASVVPVHDEAAVPVMVRIHRELTGGRGLAEAWAAARAESTGDPLAVATAASFTAWGV